MKLNGCARVESTWLRAHCDGFESPMILGSCSPAIDYTGRSNWRWAGVRMMRLNFIGLKSGLF